MTKERYDVLSTEYAQYDNKRIESVISELYMWAMDCMQAHCSGDASWESNYGDTQPEYYSNEADELREFLNIRKGIEKYEG